MSAGSAIVIRPERPGDEPDVRRLLDAAFAGPEEGELVERLRAHGDLVLSLVALDDERIVGYVAWPRLWIQTPRDEYKAIALAPLAVDPTQQRRGIGSALTREGLAQLRARGESLAFVLGDSVYYRRFGFTVEAASGYVSKYAGAHFMALRLSESAPSSGRVRYPAAFDAG